MIKRTLSLVSTAALLAGLLLVAGGATALANTSVNGAAFTTTNTSDAAGDGTGHCKNGNEAVNCNIYDGKQYVWLNGGPSTAYVGDGSYFFAVLDPGGQGGHQNPNDGTPKNLSDDFDAYTNRTFDVADGTVSYGGSHDFDSNKIRLMPYADTSNPGGVYILAICSLADGYPVSPSQCKYDAFKIQTGECTVNCGGGGQGVALTIVKDAAGSNDRTYHWTIDKSVDTNSARTAGGADGSANYTVDVGYDGGTVSNVSVSGTISVFNPNVDDQSNTIPVAIDEVTDSLSDGTVCSVTSGGSQSLADFETDFSYTCLLSALPAIQLDNTATVTWSQQDLSDGSSLTGDSADFTFSNIAFTSENAIDECVSVDDTVQGHLGDPCVGDANPTEYTYSGTISGDAGTCTDNDNTASYTANDSGATDSASQTVADCQGANLTVSKTAVSSYVRTYTWTINKTVTEASHIDQLGGSVTLHYHVTATQSGFTDSSIQATGTITVTNPNDWEDVTVDITDAVDNGGTCTVTNGTGVVVPASGTASRDYSCTYASGTLPANGTNTGTASWDASAASTAHHSADGTASVTFGAPASTTNQTITVQDKYNNGTPATLGTLTATDSSPFTSHTYDLSKTVTVPAHDCVTVPNSGIIKETGQHSDVSNTICGPANTGALTMGFWKNTNGQGLIGSYCISGSNNLGAYLKSLGGGAGPFSNAPTTCSGLKTFVTSILSGASATNMNNMLKAQMLASALDVFFSGPGWTSTVPKGAPKPPSSFLQHNSLGGFSMDTTAICPMVDNLSTGSATCTAGKPSTNAVAAGAVPASPMTMQAILDFASTVKAAAPWTTGSFTGTAASSSWYGTNRTLQEILKNIFDQFNNGDAFAG